jgi:fructokinase
MIFAGIEAGGTKFICGVADVSGTILDQCRIPTTTPAETLGAARAFFEAAGRRHGPIASLAIGSFGPLSLNPAAPDFGSIGTTPKPGWSGTGLTSYFGSALAVPVSLDTDVNCAAVGEMLFGSGYGLDSFCYVTVGTGIGVGIMMAGAPLVGMNHPEAGHMLVPRAPDDHDFPGVCSFHGDCLEGLASGPAMKARWGVRAPDLPDDHPAWAVEADYIAALCVNLTYTVRPHRIILGGGVMQRAQIFPLIREAFSAKLAGYDATAAALDLNDYIVSATAGASAGLTGALANAYHLALRKWPTHWRIAS